MTAQYRRRKYFVSARFQLKFVGVILIFMFAIVSFCLLAIYLDIWNILGDKLANVYPRGRLIAILRHANMLLMWKVAALTPLVAAVSIILSHRIAGPIFRIKRTLDQVLAGNYGLRLHLRKTDELKDVADSINELIKLLEDKTKEEK